MTTDAARADDTVRSFISEEDLLVNCQGELKVATEQVEHLQAALVTARRIGASIGILVTRMKLTDDQAFEVLRQASQHRNRKLREIADDNVYTGIFEYARHRDTGDEHVYERAPSSDASNLQSQPLATP